MEGKGFGQNQPLEIGSHQRVIGLGTARKKVRHRRASARKS